MERETQLEAYQVRSGLVLGRSHRLDGRNCQDALAHLEFQLRERPYLVGVVADGCGSGASSEVGARLAVAFVPREIRRLLSQDVELEELPTLLFAAVQHFLQDLVATYHFDDPRERVNFIGQHLLFTLLCYIITPEQTLILAAGDGLVILNDNIHAHEQQNAPAYIGYHLIERDLLAGNARTLPTGFVQQHIPTKCLTRLAIGSDAWLREMPLLADIWEISNPAGLQLRLNRWSDARHLQDDASLIVVERLPFPATSIETRKEPTDGR